MHCPPFTGAQGDWLRMKNLCFGPLKKCGFVSSGLCLSLLDRNPTAFHHWMLHGLLIHAREPGLGSRLHFSQWRAPTKMLLPWPTTHVNGAISFHIPTLSTSLEGVSTYPWPKVFFFRYCSVVHFWVHVPLFIFISSLVLGEVQESSSYSTAIL